MILKGSSRSNGSDLATHLLNGYDNERAELAQVRGTIADDLHGAFAEIELIASGTRAQKPLFSLSINPHEELSREQYFEAIDAIEKRLGFEGQPRAVVFHEKDGREHAHVVWSRIDAASMKAIPDSFYKARLCDMAIVLAERYGHELPEGLKRWKEKNLQFDEKLEPSLGETANAKKTGINPEQRRADITQAYEQADSAAAFVNALEEQGYVLAKGDSRAFVIVDSFGDVYSLSRYVKGARAKDIKARLSALDVDGLPSVAAAQAQAKARLAAQEERAREQAKAEDKQAALDAHDHVAEELGKDAFEAPNPDEIVGDEREREKRSAAQKRAQMEAVQAERRIWQAQDEQAQFTRQQEEKLALHAAQKSESSGLLFRMRAAVADLIDSKPALRSVLGHVTAQTGLDPRERHRLESEALARRHEREKRAMEGKRRALEKIEQRERKSLERDLKREALVKMRLREQMRAQAKNAAREQARGEPLWETDPRLLEEGAFGRAFNEEAVIEHAEFHGDDDEGEGESGGRQPRTHAKGRRRWRDRENERGIKQGRSKGRGYGYSRDE